MKIKTTTSIKISLVILFITICSLGCTHKVESLPVQEPEIIQPVQEPVEINHTTYNPPLKLYVIYRSVNVRSGPGKENAVIASRKKGQLFNAYGKKDDWYYTKLENGKDGYIYEPLLSDVKPRVTSTTSIKSPAVATAKTPPTEKNPVNNDAPDFINTEPTPLEPPAKDDGLELFPPKAAPDEQPENSQPDMQADSGQPASAESSSQGDAAVAEPVQVASLEEPISSVPLIAPPEEFMYTITVKTYQDRADAEESARGFMAKGYSVFLMPMRMLNGSFGYSLNVDSLFSKEEDAYRSALALSKKENVDLAIFQIKRNYNFKLRQITAH